MDGDSRVDSLASDDDVGGNNGHGVGGDRVYHMKRVVATVRSVVARIFRSRTIAWVLAIAVSVGGFWRVEGTQDELHEEIRRRSRAECEATNTTINNTERALHILVTRMGAVSGADQEVVDQFIADLNAELRHELPTRDCDALSVGGEASG